MDDQLNVARILDGKVVNIEIATAEWIEAAQGVDGYTFVVYPDTERVHIGMDWTKKKGFVETEPAP